MKKAAEFLKFLNNNTRERRRTAAVIAAAGSGLRMNSDGAGKQFVEINGKPVIRRTLEIFESCGLIDEIIVVARSADIGAIREVAEAAEIRKLSAVVPGGATRRESVAAAVAAVGKGIDFVAIHDGARCLITQSDIEKVAECAFITGAATAATRVTDTLKSVGGDNVITGTMNRDGLWAVQTPQIFHINVYRSALGAAAKSNVEVSDDCALAEAAGFKVYVVETGVSNIKLTVPGDLEIVEAIARAREGEK